MDKYEEYPYDKAYGIPYEDEEEEVDMDEEVDEEEAVIDSIPKLQIFLKIVGVIILFVALGILVYFQWEQIQINKALIPNVTSIYDGSCNEGICIYTLKNEIPKAANCYYKGNKTDCIDISFDFLVKGNKTCIEGLCTLKTIETIEKCSLGGWEIECGKIEVNQSE